MSQIGEAIAKAGMGSVGKCPFKTPAPPKDPKPQDEHYAWDDRLKLAGPQANSGGKLGSNCKKGSPGSKGTWNVLGGNPDRYTAKQVDTARNRGGKVKVRNKLFPYTVAAHHLIPGNASLFDSEFFKSYMKKDGKAQAITGEMFQISHHIGYNVNGSHNGVWLPGSYAIVAGGGQPQALGWEELNSPAGDIDWCRLYMAAVAKKAKGQFHDSHTNYNKSVLGILNKYWEKLLAHQVKCTTCRSSINNKLPPPYSAKAKLYKLSKYLRTQTQRGPRGWKDPWMTSDQVLTDIFQKPAEKKKFMKAYREAKST